MFVSRCELPRFPECNSQLSVNDYPCPASTSLLYGWAAVSYYMLKLPQMFTSKLSYLIVSITSSLLEHIFKEQYFLKGYKLSEKMVMCVKM